MRVKGVRSSEHGDEDDFEAERLNNIICMWRKGILCQDDIAGIMIVVAVVVVNVIVVAVVCVGVSVDLNRRSMVDSAQDERKSIFGGL